MDFSKLTTGGKISIGAGIALIIGLFVPWYGVDIGPLGSVNINAFDAGFFAWSGTLLALAGAVIVVLKALDVTDVKIGSLAAEQVGLSLAALGAVFILLRLITETSFLKFGIFWTLLAAAAAVYGAVASMKEQGIAMPNADDFKSITGNDEPS